MKIKQLEWGKSFSCALSSSFLEEGDWEADIFRSQVFGIKHNYQSRDNFTLFIGSLHLDDTYYCNEDELGIFDTLEEAKQAAQEHFEQFIRSCIDED